MSWKLSDGVVSIRPTEPADVEHLVAGRDAEWERWLGPGDDQPHPTACIVVDGEVVGWVDHDDDQPWLRAREVNIGYSVFAAHRRRGYAARAVRLLLRRLAEATEAERAYLAIDAENTGSLAVARSLAAVEVDRYRNDAGRLNVRYVVPIPRAGVSPAP